MLQICYHSFEILNIYAIIMDEGLMHITRNFGTVLLAVLMTAGIFGLVACSGSSGSDSASDDEFSTEDEVTVAAEETVEEEEEEDEEDEEEEVAPEGMYRSELTNEWISEDIKDQRPIAVMVDNESTALYHYGLSQADIVYEMMNSTANGYITRFMALFKDYESIDMIGSIRSTRPTNLMIAPEWNAIVCHDGGPVYINTYLANDYVDNFSGGFTRVSNGKSYEFTEYICDDDMEQKFANSSVDKEYNEYAPTEDHFQFASESNPVVLSEVYSSAISATYIDLPFDHNGSELQYDEESGTYLYYEYGKAHIDPGNNNTQLAFTNVILQEMSYSQLDSNGYMVWNCLDESWQYTGYYITGGEAIEIHWTKHSDTDRTIYYDENGEEITINTGKTYIAFVADNRWDELVVE